ncbi:hypothetical protein ACFQDG_01545 [Natronoarchaeum mannanilyticum]|uniref:Sulfatase N-terminal domain-containing protein n=1 Tax=Natronoarchaeum mannanilyticum TaxID=926360 RepID=A0AAV3TC90_9EURY
MSDIRRIRELVRKGWAEPRSIPPFVLKKTLGIEPWKFGRHAVPNALSKAVYRRASTKEPQRTIWDEEWDLLILLDSCRPEWLCEGAENRDWIDDVETVWSVGSHSAEWTEKTFADEYGPEMEDTIYVTGNPYSADAPVSRFADFENVNEREWEVDSAVPPAHVVTDRAVKMARERDWSHCIVHYMQPHKPIFEQGESRGDSRLDERWQPNATFWRQYIDGDVSLRELEGAFISNLEYVLEEVEILLENVDAPSAVVTSDHGQALGEQFLWSHRRGVKHPSMRHVPWVECSATDTRSLEPKVYRQATYEKEQRQEQLKQLGYL